MVGSRGTVPIIELDTVCTIETEYDVILLDSNSYFMDDIAWEIAVFSLFLYLMGFPRKNTVWATIPLPICSSYFQHVHHILDLSPNSTPQISPSHLQQTNSLPHIPP